MTCFQYFGIVFVALLTAYLEGRVSGEPCHAKKIFVKPVGDKALINHVIRILTVTSEEACKIQCFMEAKCESYNFAPKEGGDGHVCELSDSDAIRDPLDLVTKQGLLYVETQNPCAKSQCPVNSRCHSDFEKNTYTCECLPGFTGNTCSKSGPEEIGCFFTPNGLFSETLGDLTREADPAQALAQCNELTQNKGYHVFALGYGGLCLSGPDAQNRYYINGTATSPANCSNGIGTGRRSVVYTLDPLPEFEPVGCFKDKKSPRALPHQYASFRHFINWFNLNATIRQCALVARDIGYQYFGVQYYAECWSSFDAANTYSMHGVQKKDSKCVAKVGAKETNYVYRFP